jgi:hypothetical protein
MSGASSVDLAFAGLEKEKERKESRERRSRSWQCVGWRCSWPSPVGTPARALLRRRLRARNRGGREWDRVYRDRLPAGFVRPKCALGGQRRPASRGLDSAQVGAAHGPFRWPAGWLLDRGPMRVCGGRPWAAFSRGLKRKVLHSMFCKLFWCFQKHICMKFE